MLGTTVRPAAAASMEPEREPAAFTSKTIDSAIEWLSDAFRIKPTAAYYSADARIKPAYSVYAIAAGMALLMSVSFVLYYTIYYV